MNYHQFETWIDGYECAWASNASEDIGRLFAGDARYYPTPYSQPWVGRDEIIRQWIDRKDEPGTYSFRYEMLAVTDTHGILRGWTTYHEPSTEYSNIWVVQLDDAGQCTEFIEWWVQRPRT